MPSVEALPTPAIQAVLRQHLADPAARLTDVELEPLTTDGYSGNRLYRARVAWLGGRCAPEPGSATWVLKRWLPGGHGQRLLGVDRPLEALAWSQGILRPEVLPAGVVAPHILRAPRHDLVGGDAWLHQAAA